MLNWLIKKLTGGISVVDLYVALIISGRRTFVQIPTKYQAAVHEDLLALGLDDNGNPIVA
ncbi:MAG: hypothetical protein A2Y34_04340 [Spirochaetes bacterium GWC1_27_15]|nr:MAG: hypothetical protein A2Y34_04340 [Spirochaetes bacterium GWC1_27_15]